MPSYNKTPFAAPPELLIEGRAAYLFGSFNRNVSPTKFQVASCAIVPTTMAITNVAIASNVATVKGTLVAGKAPVATNPITITGTTVDSGAFNVTAVALASVSLAAGVYTMTFALTADDFAATNDTGSATISTGYAVVTGHVIEGNLPAVGGLISITGTVVDGGVFNVANVALSGVTLDANGVGSLTFALAHADFAAANDGGLAIIPQAEVGETLANGASVPCATFFSAPASDAARTYRAVCNFPTIPTTCTVTLEAAINNVDGEYASLGTVATVATGAVTQNQAQFTLTTAAFYRLKVSSLAGAGTIVGKILA